MVRIEHKKFRKGWPGGGGIKKKMPITSIMSMGTELYMQECRTRAVTFKIQDE